MGRSEREAISDRKVFWAIHIHRQAWTAPREEGSRNRYVTLGNNNYYKADRSWGMAFERTKEMGLERPVEALMSTQTAQLAPSGKTQKSFQQREKVSRFALDTVTPAAEYNRRWTGVGEKYTRPRESN